MPNEKLKRYYGSDAVREAARYYGYSGEVAPEVAHLIGEEGFVPGTYLDSKDIPTEGVGQTGDMMGRDFFTEVYPVYAARAMGSTKDWIKITPEARAAIVSMAYRGDWGPNTKKALRKGEWEEAAKQYLDHDEYRKGKQKGATKAQKAISARMDRNAQVLRDLAETGKK